MNKVLALGGAACTVLALAACAPRNSDGTVNLNDAETGCRNGVQYFNADNHGWEADHDKDGNLLSCGGVSDTATAAQPDSSASDLNSSVDSGQ